MPDWPGDNAEGDDPVTVPIGPELDLHAFAPRDIPSVVEEYVHAAAAAGLTTIRLVHGRGRGVQRAIVQRVLAQLPGVQRFWDDTRAHLGATVAELRAQGHLPRSPDEEEHTL